MANSRFIPLHPFRINWILDGQYAADSKGRQKFLERVKEKPFILSSIGKYALGEGVYELVKHHSKDKFLDSVRMAHISRTWNWVAMLQPGPHQIQLPDETMFECNAVEPNSDIDFGTWLQGLYIAMILRDIGAVKVYGEADPEKIVRYGQNTPDPWEIPYIKFLNAIWAYDTNIAEYLKDALKGSDPAGYNTMRADWMLNMLSPLLELWAMVFTHNEARFNEKLYEQQQLRHDWHVALTEESGNSIMEYIDLAALATCCYAHDKGFEITVKSAYLPEFLIKGDFPKLEWPDPEWKS